MYKISPIIDRDKNLVVNFFTENWGSSIIVSRGKIHKADTLRGFQVIENDKIIGLLTFFIENNEFEIVSLDSLKENVGIGSLLIKKAIIEAKNSSCNRVWLITTNDNTSAIRFYQKHGFNMVALHKNAIKASRCIKPEIPELGFDNIPILHEIEFEYTIE